MFIWLVINLPTIVEQWEISKTRAIMRELVKGRATLEDTLGTLFHRARRSRHAATLLLREGQSGTLSTHAQGAMRMLVTALDGMQGS